jgi:hypothetical protein
VKKVFFILFIVYPSLLFSQGVLMNKKYDNHTNIEGAFSILHEENFNHWIISGPTSDFLSFDASYIVKINNEGDTLWTRTINLIPDFEACWGSCFSKTGNYVFVGKIKDSLNVGFDVLMFQLDTSGNLQWWKRYGGTGDESSQMVKLTKDGGFIIAGWTTTNTNGNEDAYIIKTDSIGNELWEQQFGLNYPDVFYSVDVTKDFGYIFGGATLSYGNHSRDLYIVKTDSMGQLQWYKNYGTANEDFGKEVISTLDVGYAISGNIETQFAINKDGCLLKLDSIGNMQWDLIFGTDSIIESFESVSQLSNGDYILVGGSGRNNFEGLLVKANSTGDTLWSKYYRLNPISIYNQHYFYDQFTLENKIAICGMTIESNMPNRNDFWLVVTDSVGCYDTSCIFNDINESDFLEHIELFPNPADDVVYISAHLTFNKPYKVNILNLSGQLVLNNYINSSNDLLKLDISGLPSGFYILKLLEVNNQFSKKLIIKK